VGSSGSQAEGPEDVRKLVEDQEGVGRGQEEVGKAVGEGGRSGRTWESNGTLQDMELEALLSVDERLKEFDTMMDVDFKDIWDIRELRV